MKPSLEGDLGFMPLPDLLQWLEQGRKTATVGITNEADESAVRSFYFQDGQIIFVSSNLPGERFGDFVTQTGHLDEKAVNNVLLESRKWGLCFTQHLIDTGLVSAETLTDVLARLAESILMTVLSSQQGRFEVSGTLPMVVKNGPVHLGSSHLIMDVIRKMDEKLRDREG